MLLKDRFDLSGEVVAVTGGSGVLMSGIAEALAECGAAVAIIGRRAEPCERVACRITEKGGRAIAAPADCTDVLSVEACRDRIVRAFGPVTLLVNGAGGNSPRAVTDIEYASEAGEGKTFFDITPEGTDFVFDANMLTAFVCARVFCKDMAAAHRGNVINISSMGAFLPLTKTPVYCAAKAGISNFTRWLAVHFASVGIRVNAIAPGFFSAEQNRKLLYNADGTPAPRTKKILGHTPMGRFGEPEDLYGTLLWLADGSLSGFVTGVTVAVDGGFSAYGGV